MAVDPKFATTATTATATTSRPPSSIPQPQPQSQPQAHHHYPQLSKPHEASQAFLYPVSSSGRGFIPKGVRPFSGDHNIVTVANPGGYQPPSLVYSHGVRAHLDFLNNSLHMARPPHLHYPHMASPVPAPVKGVPVSAHPKAADRAGVSDSNGYKDTSTRERSRDDSLCIIRHRKVPITEDASLYALCRSWLRNGVNEEDQPQKKDVMKALPKPLPASVVASYMSNKKEDEKDDDEQQENEDSVESLSPQDLLKRHIKGAKKVRARLREERLQRIARYRSRLRLLLPPPVEQFRNDTAAGN